jgi:hypothetical protein
MLYTVWKYGNKRLPCPAMAVVKKLFPVFLALVLSLSSCDLYTGASFDNNDYFVLYDDTVYGQADVRPALTLRIDKGTFETVKLGATYQYQLSWLLSGDLSFTAFASLRNILNAHYESFAGYNMPGISLTLGGRVKFNLESGKGKE